MASELPRTFPTSPRPHRDLTGNQSGGAPRRTFAGGTQCGGAKASTRVAVIAARGRTGAAAAAVAMSRPPRPAPAASPISTPRRRDAYDVLSPGLTSLLTSPVRVPVRNVVDTSVMPMSLTADDCTPIAAAATASRQNCAHPAGLAPLISHPTLNP